jgi:crotonobetainyl-CoA:carnitine CoA-transferase CaiB-like acyl-CoA transferase
MSRTPADPTNPGPALGEHTTEVLRSLGLRDDEIAALEESGAVAGPHAGARGSFMA